MMESIAVVIGEGYLPELIIRSLKTKNIRVFGLAIEGAASRELALSCDETLSLALTQIGKAIKECSKRGISQVIFAGRVKHAWVFDLSLLKMDWTTLKIWNSLPDKRTDTILGKVVQAFENKGIRCLRQTEFLQEELLAPSSLASPLYPKALLKEAFFGFRMAKGLGSLDIGQSVVVKDQAVVAVEAVEGTNKCLKRAHDLAGEGCVLIKVAKPRQDFRFDVPIIGPQTIDLLKQVKAKALVVEAHSTLFLEKQHCLKELNNHHIPLLALTQQSLSHQS